MKYTVEKVYKDAWGQLHPKHVVDARRNDPNFPRALPIEGFGVIVGDFVKEVYRTKKIAMEIANWYNGIEDNNEES